MPREPGRTDGFTLIELLLVLAILSLAAGLAVPLLAKRVPHAGLSGAVAETRAALAAVRSAAIAENREIAFSGAATGYRIDGRTHRFASAGDLAVEIRGGSRIAFFPSGASSGGRVVLHGAGSQREIAIEAMTGRAILLP